MDQWSDLFCSKHNDRLYWLCLTAFQKERRPHFQSIVWNWLGLPVSAMKWIFTRLRNIQNDEGKPTAVLWAHEKRSVAFWIIVWLSKFIHSTLIDNRENAIQRGNFTDTTRKTRRTPIWFVIPFHHQLLGGSPSYFMIRSCTTSHRKITRTRSFTSPTLRFSCQVKDGCVRSYLRMLRIFSKENW